MEKAAADWAEWSREAVQLMQERTNAWLRDYSLQDRHYHWSLDDAKLVFPSEGEHVTTVKATHFVLTREG